MAEDEGEDMPTIVPMIAYEDAAKAIDWLGRAFGFRERKGERVKDGDGRITHAELRLGKGRVFLAMPTPDYRSPKHHRETCAAARKWSAVPWVIDGLLVHVDDIDQHFARAKSAGATLLSDLEDQPYGRLYRAEDVRSHGRVREPTRRFLVHMGPVVQEDFDGFGMAEERREAERVEALLLGGLVDPDARLAEDRLEPPRIPDRRGLVQVQRVLRRPREEQLDDVSRSVERGRQNERPVRSVHPEEGRIPIQDGFGLGNVVLLSSLEQLVLVPHYRCS